MMQVSRVGSVQVSPEGKRVVYAVRRAVMSGDQSEYRTQISLTTVGGNRTRQLTQGEKSCDDPQWSPDGQWVTFISARTGKKNLWIISAEGGEAIRLTDHMSDITSYRWSAQGRAIAFTAVDPISPDEERRTREKNDARVVDENIKLSRLFVVDFTGLPTQPIPARSVSKGTMSVLSEPRTGRSGYDWSPDGTKLVFASTASPRPDDWATADLMLIDVSSGDVTPLCSTKSAETSPLFSPDGKWIAMTVSDDPPTWAGSRTVQVIPATGGQPEILAETQDGFGRYSELVGWSAGSSRIYYTEVQGTSLKLLALPLKGSPVEVSPIEGLASAGMSFGGVSINSSRTFFGFGWEKLDQPSEAFVSLVASFSAIPVSHIHAELPKPPLGRTELIHWNSTEGNSIEGLLTYPVDYQAGTRYPLLVVVHGGPMGVFTNLYDGIAGVYPIAAFASRGYAVLRPNPRGSSGYGKKFRFVNYGDWGGGDFRDVMSGVDHVIATGVADADRLGIMGWSYGGFMTSWAITQTKRFKAASVGAGVTNLISFTGTTDIPSFIPDYFGGEYWDKPDGYPEHSPMLKIKGVTTPTLIQHGERDERVPQSQGVELYNALKRQSCPTKMVIYPRTPHAVEEPRLMLDCMNRNLEWFDQYIGAAKP